MLRSILIIAGASLAFAGRAFAQAGSDTLPARVVQRGLDAWKRKDVRGSYAEFDTTFVHEGLQDSTGPHVVRRAAYVDALVKDSANIAVVAGWKITRVQRTVAGPWVLDVYTLRSPNGKRGKHVDIYEVRHGKVVREIEGDS